MKSNDSSGQELADNIKSTQKAIAELRGDVQEIKNFIHELRNLRKDEAVVRREGRII